MIIWIKIVKLGLRASIVLLELTNFVNFQVTRVAEPILESLK
jgi:hypothetical protein